MNAASQINQRRKRPKQTQAASGGNHKTGTLQHEAEPEDLMRNLVLEEQKAQYFEHLQNNNLVRDPMDPVMIWTRTVPPLKPKKQRVPWPVAHPQNPFRAAWGVVIGFSALYTIAVTPLEMVFNLFDASLLLYLVSLIVNFFFIIDIIINFFTAVENRFTRTLIVNPIHIARHYVFCDTFLLDFVATIPFQVFYRDLYFVKALRLVSVAKFIREMTRRLDRPGMALVTFNLIVPALWCLIFIHWSACLWIKIHVQDDRDAGDNDDLNIYLRAFYFIVTTITTVGYGDISPVNNVQILYTLCIQVVGVGFYAYLFGRMVDASLALQRANSERRERMNVLNAFMNYRKYPEWLKKQIWDYHNYHFDQLQSEELFGPAMSLLSPQLRKVVALHEKNAVIESCPRLSNLGMASKRLLSEHLEPTVFVPGQLIYGAGDPADMVYFVERGHMSIEDPISGERLRDLSTGMVFGHIDLKVELEKLLDEDHNLKIPVRAFNAVARTHLSVYSISLSVLGDLARQDTSLFLGLIDDLNEINRSLLKKTIFRLEDETISKMAPYCALVNFSEGSFVFLNGDPPDYVYMVYSGELHRSTPVTVLTMGKGAFVGELEAIQGIPRAASVFAARTTILFRMDKKKFIHIYSSLENLRDVVDKNSSRKEVLGSIPRTNSWGEKMLVHLCKQVDDNMGEETENEAGWEPEVSEHKGNDWETRSDISRSSHITGSTHTAMGGGLAQVELAFRDLSILQKEVTAAEVMRADYEQKLAAATRSKQLAEQRFQKQFRELGNMMRFGRMGVMGGTGMAMNLRNISSRFNLNSSLSSQNTNRSNYRSPVQQQFDKGLGMDGEGELSEGEVTAVDPHDPNCISFDQDKLAGLGVSPVSSFMTRSVSPSPDLLGTDPAIVSKLPPGNIIVVGPNDSRPRLPPLVNDDALSECTEQAYESGASPNAQSHISPQAPDNGQRGSLLNSLALETLDEAAEDNEAPDQPTCSNATGSSGDGSQSDRSSVPGERPAPPPGPPPSSSLA